MPKENKIRKSLKASFWDGFFASGMSGLINDYIIPYALVLKATTPQIGALTALPSLAASIAQLKSADLTEKLKSHRKTITIFVLLHALMLLPVISIPYLFKTHPVLFLIFFITLFNAFNSIAGPVYSSLIAEYIPYNMRGRYFGWRSRTLNAVVVISSLISGFILHYFEKNVLRGFMIIFSIAFISRLISWYFLTRMHEPPFRIEENSQFSFFDFVKRIRESNFVKFTLFFASFQFCVNLAAPFFSVFMLRDLKFNYLTYTFLVSTVATMHIFTLSRWGRCMDRVGSIRVLRVSSLIIASLPLWWIISQNPVYLFFTQVVAGFAWSGFNLCPNFIYDAVTPQKRVRCFAYFNIFVGLGTFLGGVLGGLLANILPNIFGYKLLSLFLIASALRFAVVFLFSGKIQEVRKIEYITTKDLFCSVVGIKPIHK